MLKKILSLACFIAISAILFAQTNPAYKPTREEILERYKQAAISDSTINRGKIFNLTVQPTWLDDGKEFLYGRYTLLVSIIKNSRMLPMRIN
ncbi:MAG: hypothetical protein QM763_06240 [Agriterribacter sp.]